MNSPAGRPTKGAELKLTSARAGRAPIMCTALLAVGALTLIGCSSSSKSNSGSGGGASGSGGGGSSSGGSYTIDVLTDLTGIFAQPGATVNAGIQAYAKQINNAGGVNGKTIKLVVTDTQSTDAASVAGLQKAIASKPVAMLQDGNSSFSAMLPLLKQASDIPFFTAGATDSALYPTPVANVFMAQASATQQANALVAEVKAKLGTLQGKKVGVLYGSAPYNDDLLKTVKSLLQAGGGSTGDVESYNFGSVSFTSQAAKVASSKPDAVIHLGDSADSETGLKALVAAGITSVPILSYSSGSTDQILKGVDSPNVAGLRTTVTPATGTAILSAAQALGAASGATDNNFTLGWAEAATAIEGLKECGSSCTSSQLLTKLNTISSYSVPSDALYGPVSISSSKHAILSSGQFYSYNGSAVVTAGAPVSLGN
jgi:branched-chain amino acid transport system substrate-binding protein